ncbi:MAG: hypothetical protein OXN95_06880 [bacterium]|nr:hypothetical protein [bacterium]
MLDSREAVSRHLETVNRVCEEGSQGDFFLEIATIHSRLKQLAGESPEDEALRALVIACAYCAGPVDPNDPAAMGPFGPMWESPEAERLRVYPIPLSQVDEATLDIWAEGAAEESLHPLVRSRLADLLWVRRHDGQRRWFRTAIDAYIELASTQVVATERESGLARAVEICKESNHPHLISAPLDALKELAERSLNASPGKFGVVARALDVLVSNDYPCSDLIDDAVQRYGDDPNQKSDLLGIGERAAPDEDERMRLRRERIGVFEEAADGSSGLMRVSYLEDARTLAHQVGLSEEVGRLTAMIEYTDIESEMETFTQEIEIDADGLRAWADEMVGDDSLPGALGRFGAMIPIDDPDDTRAALDEMASDSVLQSLVTTVHYGPENSLMRIPPGDPLHSDIRLGQHNALVIQVFAGTTGKMVLDSVREKYDPQPQDLADWFACEAAPPGIARRIAKSYERWAAGDYISAVSVIILTLELIVRRVCRQAGIPVTLTGYSGPAAPGVRTLGYLLGDLEPLLGPTATRYLQASLTDQWSLNLRNALAHVLVEELDETQYLVLFHLTCLLRHISGVLSEDA